MSLLEALKEIRRRLDCGEDLPLMEEGICFNIDALLFKNVNVQAEPQCKLELYPLIKKWPNCSDEDFPVEGSLYDYEYNIDKWNKSTKYGKLRHELLDFLITESEKVQ